MAPTPRCKHLLPLLLLLCTAQVPALTPPPPSSCNNPMLCDCTQPGFPSPSPSGLLNLFTYLKSTSGLPLSHLVPLAFWNSSNSTTLTPAERVRLSYSMSVADGGMMQLALALASRFSESASLTHLMYQGYSDLTHLRGDSSEWLYGEQNKSFDCTGGCNEGYFFSQVSDSETWPDPAELANRSCTWDTCKRIQFSGGVPSLHSTVWAAFIGPLQTDWMRYRIRGGRPIPPNSDSVKLLETVLTALRDSRSWIGGYYESPMDAGKPTSSLRIDIASNLELYAASVMALKVSSISTGLSMQLQDIQADLRKVMFGFTPDGVYYFWDTAAGAFRGYVDVPRNTSEAVELGEWSLQAQLVAMHVLGAWGIDRNYNNSAGTAAALWNKVLQTYAVYATCPPPDCGPREISVPVGLSDAVREGDKKINTETTLFAASAALALAEDYASDPRYASLAAKIKMDVVHIRNFTKALPSVTCKVLSNVTLPLSPPTPGPVSVIAYLASRERYNRPNPQGGELSEVIPVVSLSATALGLVVQAASNPSIAFNPYKLLPVPPPSTVAPDVPPPSKGWWAANWGFFVGGAVASVALVLSVGKAVQITRRRRLYNDLKEAEQCNNGRNLGFF